MTLWHFINTFIYVVKNEHVCLLETFLAILLHSSLLDKFMCSNLAASSFLEGF